MFRHPFRHTFLVTSLIVFGMTLGAAPEVQEKTTEGTVVRTSGTQLALLVSPTSEIQRFSVASDAVVRRDGSEVKLTDVKIGDFALISTKGNDSLPIATAIAALSPQKMRVRQRQ